MEPIVGLKFGPVRRLRGVSGLSGNDGRWQKSESQRRAVSPKDGAEKTMPEDCASAEIGGSAI